MIAMRHTRAFSYESIADRQANMEMWRDLALAAGVIVLGIFCPAAGVAAGMALGALDLASSASGKDWGTGRELDGDKLDSLAIYDVVYEPNYYMFKIKFVAYDYFWIQFNYDNDLCGFSIVLNDQFGVSLEDKMRSYAGTHDWKTYLKEIIAKIEIRTPDKFLKAKGWL